MTKNLEVVRTSGLVAGTSYAVEVHGFNVRQMKLKVRPEGMLSKMTTEDQFVCQCGKKEIVFTIHGSKGPQFLVTKVPGSRGGLVNARVTFYDLKSWKAFKAAAAETEQAEAETVAA